MTVRSTDTDIELTSVRAYVDCPGGGAFVLVGAPGVAVTVRGDVWFNPESRDLTFDELVELKTDLIVYLACDDDGLTGQRLVLREQARRRGIRFVALPIRDFGTPGEAWIRAWRRIKDQVQARLDNGRSIGLCCSYGAGRSGTVAAYALMERGLAAAEALEKVRGNFPEAIESPVQEAWLRSQHPTWTEGDMGTWNIDDADIRKT